MKKKTALLTTLAFGLMTTAAIAASEAEHPPQMNWPFDGITGRVDKQSAQRGFQVYKEVCSACHSLKRVHFRSLTELGFSEAEVKALAASYQVTDGPNDDGEMFQRPGKPSDHFVPPFANDKAAAAANKVAPPDLSLMVKARPDGANYVHALLVGYGTAPEGHAVPEGLHYNKYFPGGNIAMAPPLSDGSVTYADGTQASVDQMSTDVVNFLQWAAEPEMEQRKRMGIKVMIYLALMTIVLYFAKRRIWSRVH